ncbi:S8 family serine peptidase [Zhenpiania hominis]|uniref:S8 family serine peptidase n=1 Tax=Zhenpiania hominis TaxID=2763644 RepID=A0A923NS45_9FIRM|nr:S8 family serine peptidase [Zhenpiania hominis]MBC6681023.1 S8 family serine peptidase [Zhenpiania hominis]
MKIGTVIRCCIFGSLVFLLSAGCCIADADYAEDMGNEDTNEILVTFKEDVTKTQAQRTIEKANGDVEETFLSAGSKTLVVSHETKKAQAAAISSLEQKPEVEAVQPNYHYTLDEADSSNDPLFPKQWNLDYMDVPEAWDLIDKVKPKSDRKEEDRVIVATLDTGIHYEHSDLKKNIDVSNCISVTGQEEPYRVYKRPRFSHGTATGGILAATSRNGVGMAGVAAGNNNDLVSLMGIDVFHEEGYHSQASASTADIIKGIEYACEKGAKVINMCLGHTTGDLDLYGQVHDDAALEAAVNDAVYNKDVVITCSAGNKGDSRPWYPSDFDAVISVISTKQYTNSWSRDCKAKSSSYGAKKDISAPGKSVYTTELGGGFRKGGGTSLATPAVAGVVALIRYVNPQLSASQVKHILYSTATDLYKTGYDTYTGYGNVNAYRAVAAAAGVNIGKQTETLSVAKSVRARSAGAHSIRISWKKVPGANGYWIYRANKKNGTYTKIRTTTDSKQYSICDGGRKFNKTYFYKVVAYGTTKDGKQAVSSGSKIVRSKARSAVPVTKTGRLDYQTIRLSWKRAKSADGYQIGRASSPNGPYKLAKTIKKGGSGSWTDRRRKPGKTYYYKMRSYRLYKKKRYCSEWSESVSIKASPKTPSFSAKKKNRSVVLKWKKTQAGKISGYKIYRKTDNRKWHLIKTVSPKQKYYRNRGLKRGVRYSYKIRSYKKVKGKIVYSNYSKVKTRRL